MFSEWVPFSKFSDELGAFVDRGDSFFNVVKRWSRITFLDDGLIFVEFLSCQGRSDDVFLVIGQIGKKSDSLKTLSVFTVVTNDDFFDCFSESLSIDDPETAWFFGSDWGSSGSVVKKGQLSKTWNKQKITVLGLEFLFEFAVDKEFENSFFDDKEAMAKLPGLKDKGVFIDVTVEHFFFDVLKFTFGEVVEDEVIFEAVDDEIGVVEGFFFWDKFNILCDSVLDSFDFFGLVMGEELSLGFGSDGWLFA